MERKIKILHLEDNPKDSQLVQSVLKRANVTFDYFFADNEQDFISLINNQNIDIILSDYHLPDYSGSEALLYAKSNFPNTPFVFVSGTMGEDAAIESLLNGATDYVLKNRLERLTSAVSRAFNEAQEQKARQKAEKELRKLSRAVEQSPNSIFITDLNGIIEYVNPTTIKLAGYTNEELIGQNPRIFGSAEKSREEYAFLWETIKAGKEWKGEFHNKKKSGELFWTSTTISPILNDDDEITHYVAINEDVTESKKLTIELIKAKEKAEESDRLKTAFLHNISHEIRTPMNAIVGFSGFLHDPNLNFEKRKQFTDIIVQSSNQLLSIISDIVNIATVEAGQERIHESEISLNSILRLLYEQFLIKAQKQHLVFNLKTFLSDYNDRIISDETKLVQILTNLIGNALKFTQQGHVNFGYTIKNNELEFFIEDTGIGVHPEMYDEIFKRFRQVESTMERKFGGSGLGLSISKAYVELLGGKIWLISELDKGTTFFFTIPFKRTKPNALFEKQTNIELGKEIKKHNTLLVAEDEDSNFMLIEEQLLNLDFNIIRAKNGIEAVDICKLQYVDMVLMDIKMPLLDGYEATKQIRVFKPNLPIIAQTAYSTDNDKNRAFESGCSDFITKPIKQELLISKIKGLLS
ncbi:MAG: response regulator [Bacteroidetes bacterium]|nr:response regulator [Bacteroidota bacterium]